MRPALVSVLFICLGVGIHGCGKKAPLVAPFTNTTRTSIDTPRIVLPDSGVVYPYTDTFYGIYTTKNYSAFESSTSMYDYNYIFVDSFPTPVSYYVLHPGHDKFVISSCYGDFPSVKYEFTVNATNFYFGSISSRRFELSTNFFAAGMDTFQIDTCFDYKWTYDRIVCGNKEERHVCHFIGKLQKK